MKYLLILLSLICFTIAGCGPKLQGFNGKVNYDGKPLPEGVITFTPDAEKGNLMGASNLAVIKDGEYKLPVSQGISGGWYKVTVESSKWVEEGGDGKEVHNIPPYTFSHEFKPEDKNFDIEIPVTKSKK